MKKFALLLLIAVMLVPAFNRTVKAESPVYTLTVNKCNGGFLSLINLYGNVTYSEVYDAGNNCINGVMNCYGQGYTRCRVPSDAGNYNNSLVPTTDMLPEGVAEVVNGMIDNSERKFELGQLKGSESKKVLPTTSSVKSTSSRSSAACKKPMYVYSSKWNYDANSNGSMTISVYKMDASILGL